MGGCRRCRPNIPAIWSDDRDRPRDIQPAQLQCLLPYAGANSYWIMLFIERIEQKYE